MTVLKISLIILHITSNNLTNMFIKAYKDLQKNLFTISLIFSKKYTKISHFSYLSIFI